MNGPKKDVADMTLDEFRETAANGVPMPPAHKAKRFMPSELPIFPVDLLPAPVADMVRAVAESTQTHPDMAAATALGTLAACTRGKLQVQGWEGWEEPVTLWVAIQMEPGENKSAVVSAMAAPLRKIEKEFREQERPAYLQEKERRQFEKDRIKELQHKIITGKKVENPDDQAKGALVALGDLEGLPPLVEPRLLIDDATPEALAHALIAAGGFLAHIKDEGDFFVNASGQYKTKAALGQIINCYNGAPFQIDRRGAERAGCDRAVLGLVIALQPKTLAAAFDTPVLNSKGLMERFLYVTPRSLAGTRDMGPKPMPSGPQIRYEQLSRALFEKFGKASEIVALSLTGDALRTFKVIRDSIEPKLLPGGEYEPIAAVVQKLQGGGILRLAAVLEVANNIDARQVSAASIDAAGQMILRYFIPHAMAVFSQHKQLRIRNLIASATGWIQREGLKTFSRSQLHHGIQHILGTTESVSQLLKDMCEQRVIELVPPLSGKNGRPPETYRLISTESSPYETYKTPIEGGSIGFIGNGSEPESGVGQAKGGDR